MPIEFDASQVVAADGRTCMLSLPIGVLANRILVMGICDWDSDNANDSAIPTVGGVTTGVTFLARRRFANNCELNVYYKLAPASGVNNLAVTVSNASSTGTALLAASYGGVHQTVPFGAASGFNGTGTAVSMNVASVLGEIVLGLLAWQAQNTRTLTWNQQPRIQYSFGKTGAGLTENVAVGSPTTVTGTLSVASPWAGIAVVLKAAAGSPPASVPNADSSRVAVTDTVKPIVAAIKIVESGN